MWRSMLKVAAATAVFGVAHSVLASRTAKRAAAETFGERNRNGLYRVFYIAQSARHLRAAGRLHPATAEPRALPGRRAARLS